MLVPRKPSRWPPLCPLWTRCARSNCRRRRSRRCSGPRQRLPVVPANWNRCGRTPNATPNPPKPPKSPSRWRRPRRRRSRDGGLRRRVRGAQLPSPGASGAAVADTKPRHDPEATKAAMDGFAERLREGRRGHRADGRRAARRRARTGVTCPGPRPRGRAAGGHGPVHGRRAVARDGLMRRAPRCPARPRPASADRRGRAAARAVANRSKRDPAARDERRSTRSPQASPRRRGT